MESRAPLRAKLPPLRLRLGCRITRLSSLMTMTKKFRAKISNHRRPVTPIDASSQAKSHQPSEYQVSSCNKGQKALIENRDGGIYLMCLPRKIIIIL